MDSLCACKILQAMFRADDVEHTVIPVSGKQDVKAAYGDHAHLVSAGNRRIESYNREEKVKDNCLG